LSFRHVGQCCTALNAQQCSVVFPSLWHTVALSTFGLSRRRIIGQSSPGTVVSVVPSSMSFCSAVRDASSTGNVASNATPLSRRDRYVRSVSLPIAFGIVYPA
jgi:hypothetical protein